MTIPFILRRVIKRLTIFTDTLLLPIVSCTVASKKNSERKRNSKARTGKGSDVAFELPREREIKEGAREKKEEEEINTRFTSVSTL